MGFLCRAPADNWAAQAAEPRAGVLRRDPYCGTYVSPEISFSLQQADQIEHFCSAECRDRFLRSGRYLSGLQVQPAPDLSGLQVQPTPDKVSA
jgi:hypothetical protein